MVQMKKNSIYMFEDVYQATLRELSFPKVHEMNVIEYYSKDIGKLRSFLSELLGQHPECTIDILEIGEQRLFEESQFLSTSEFRKAGGSYFSEMGANEKVRLQILVVETATIHCPEGFSLLLDLLDTTSASRLVIFQTIYDKPIVLPIVQISNFKTLAIEDVLTLRGQFELESELIDHVHDNLLFNHML
ncbi:hypothetical protein [Candidatus Enterococcus leclercqii]|uniref:hypothetical protein n=1 Tax=Candidatus Enterococcus leclercqii TaxID=1857218 RepID=UPI00137AB333|nr:hypothetical protein [Enterococcus sp. CU9D]KAF1294148.1 hypothetical protein BAU14_07100 [Enterococcus sp. CU9D]